ncbi:hypothetical protein O6H91_13G043300 [Diphasiastrum complanatum]|uniref:Uncharacterized protein n=1 Tax=Diphasiastrum complanatum TaxID=34168 RepID=A0ACC2BU52_DIPCM|nr:hypothetical protein O6H91_13G043300 [Diphasiastrum complanatum]
MAQEQLREATARSQNRRPRVVIVGAGIAGLSAANRLQSGGNLLFELTVLEASDRVGGRICSFEFAGEKLELGATWIHGIEGSPIYEIAETSGALEGAMPWERMDGYPTTPIVKAEGGLVVEPVLMKPVTDLYSRLLSEAQKLRVSDVNQAANGSLLKIENALSGTNSLGGFFRQGLEDFFHEQEKTPKTEVASACPTMDVLALRKPIEGSRSDRLSQSFSHGWDLHSLQEGVFTIHENHERCVTAADSLYDIDLESFSEYREFPGKQITISKGFSSIVNVLSDNLSAGILQFGRKVTKICWTDSHLGSSVPPVVLFCDDGSKFQADHVIITVSLGVLKAGTGVESRGFLNEDGKSYRKEIENKSHSLCELFHPPLPRWKLGPICRLGFGLVDKLFLKLEPFQGERMHQHMQFIHKKCSENNMFSKDGIPRWMGKTFSLYPVHKKSHILLAWFAGKEALEMESLTEEEIKKGVINTLSSFGYVPRHPLWSKSGSSECADNMLHERMAESASLRNGDCFKECLQMNEDVPLCSIKRSRWGTNPLFRGSYSYVAVGSSGADIELLAEPLPSQEQEGRASSSHAAPLLQLLFAGEATHRHHYSTTHGAYLSGVREADRLLQHYDWSN